MGQVFFYVGCVQNPAVQINHPERIALSAVALRLASGAAGIRQTTQLMAEIVAEYQRDPGIQAQAISIVQLNQPKDEPSEIRALFDFVRDSIRYVGDVYEHETVRTPDKTIALRAGDCDDKSVLLATLLRSIGYDAAFIVTGYTMPGTFEHVYVGVNLDGQLIPLDTTEPMPMGWEAPGAVSKYVQTIPDRPGGPSVFEAIAWWLSPV